MERVCRRCKLYETSRGPVWGHGDPQARLWWAGEAPGGEEDVKGKPFVGKAGKESDNYKSRHGIRTEPQYTTNLVKCRPPKNRDPKPEEIEACRFHFAKERGYLTSDHIVATLGRYSTAAVLGWEEASMDMVHAIPQRHPDGYIVVPVYHPAAGLYDGRLMTQINEGYKAVADAYNGIIKPEDWEDKYPQPRYFVLHQREIKNFPLRKVVAVDCERVGNVLWSIQISNTPGVGFFISANDFPVVRWLKTYLEGEDVTVIIQNAQHDLPLLAQVGIHPKNWVDTMLVANLLCDVPRGLKPLAYRLCGMKMQSYKDLVDPYNDAKILPYLEEVASIVWPDPEPVKEIKKGRIHMKQPQPIHTRVKRILSDREKGKGKGPYERWMDQPKDMREMVEDFLGPFHRAHIGDVPFDEALYYAARDPDATLRVFPKLMARLEAYGLTDALDLDHGIVEMLARMEHVGVEVSTERLEVISSTMEETKEKCLKDIKSTIGYWLNPGSHDQVRKLLYRELRIKAPKKKGEQTKPTTDKDYLEKIKDLHPVIPMILEYRAADKLKGSFSDRLLKLVDRYDRVHDDISQIRTTTGRLTASIMLLIPRQGPLAPTLRECFVAGEDKVFLCADYSQIELRVLAHFSQDPKMLQVYRDNGDIHVLTACEIFGITPDKVDKMKHRYPAKAVNFGIPYGISEVGLYDQLGRHGWSEDDCLKLKQNWFKVYKGADQFIKDVTYQARRYGFVTTLSGRRRLIPEVRSVFPWIRNRGLREAVNHPIQGSANEIMKVAMAKLWDQWKYWRHEVDFYIEPIIQVHDDLKWEIEAGHLDYVVPVIRHIMESSGGLCIPTPVDMEVGINWKEMEELCSS